MEGVRLLTIVEAADTLRVSKKRVYELIRDGQIKAVKFDSIRVRNTDLEAFINNLPELAV